MRLFLCALIALVVTPGRLAAAPAGLIHKSLVRIQTISQDPDYDAPWSTGEIGQGIGTGFVIEGNRILTNAHVVSNARMIWITRESDSTRYAAKIQHVAHDCDLAVVVPMNPRFFKGMEPLALNGIPEIESTVSVYGYPVGGDRASVTRGIVSRVDFQSYTHSGADSHLVIQIDAAINPGNSGGPVTQDGKVVGVAFQGYSGEVAQNTGYMIPTSVIKRFLHDIEDGRYDHYVDLAITWFPLYNPAAREALALPDDGQGVLISKVYNGGSAQGILKSGDVILNLDGHAVSSDGSVQIDGSDVQLAEVIERKFKGDTVTLDLIREGKPLHVAVPLNEPYPVKMFANAYDVSPRYVVFAGLVFQPLEQNYVNLNPLTNPRTRYYFDHYLEDNLYRDHPEIIILSNILSDPVNAYASEFQQDMVDKINGRVIKRLDDVAAAFAAPAKTYVVEFIGASRPLVLEARAVAGARQRILGGYNVHRESNLKP